MNEARLTNRAPLPRAGLLQRLAMLRDVEAFQLMLARYPQRHERAHQLQQHERHPAGPHQGDDDAVELNQQLLRVTLDQT